MSAAIATAPAEVPAATLNLCFHGIGTPRRALEPDESQYWVGVDQFDEMLEAIAGRPSTRITFDDGNASDVEHALPALVRRDLTATFFVVAGRIDAPGSLSAEAIRRLVSAGMTVGSHGLAHRPWRATDAPALQAELNASHTIADVAGVAVREAACPFGSYDRRVLSALRRHGFTRVYTVDEGPARPDAWLQNRHTIRGHESAESIERLVSASARRTLHSVLCGGKTIVKRLR